MRCRHCWVWHVVAGGQVANQCAHCGDERERWEPVDAAGDMARVAWSLGAHARGCTRPARLPLPLRLSA